MFNLDYLNPHIQSQHKKNGKNCGINNQPGFTIIELLVVLLIIGALVGLSIFIIKPEKLRNESVDKSMQAELFSLASGLEAFYLTYEQYPISITDPRLDNFVKSWPRDSYDDSFRYVPDLFGGYKEFAVYVPSISVEDGVYKYSSAYNKVMLCEEAGVGDSYSVCNTTFCGNGYCASYESCSSCATDCGPC